MTAETAIAVASVDKVLTAFRVLVEVPAEKLGASRTLNMPALTVTPAQIAEAVQKRFSRGDKDGAIEWKPVRRRR